MSKTAYAAILVPLAATLAGAATHLDGLAGIGIVATMIAVFAVRTRAKDRRTSRISAFLLSIGFVADAIVARRHPEVAFSVVLGIASWKVAILTSFLCLLDALGVPDAIEAKTAAINAHTALLKRS